ncbi:cytidine deaminase [Gordonia sp. (in: high G+C Gram-positive bacteria)]|uniref:cytidine deaminase n=1 Tax=Gordonia sp. (in: high G+C Gram-positive bacteria) TaxID=84139 RepID=UPI00169165A0|nr:cytidine deaminase [Gordonia sp. (in: high G+C Gram-positive bacteria)]NLG47840.1 cytidine deaminase [Gordonia sp. (in: high G+C Gram-positive bacteria)]
MSDAIDFARLRDAAHTVMTRAYAPYSDFGVGAAGVTSDGEVIVGCNVENVSYGLGVCAEVSMICSGFSLGLLKGSVADGGPHLVAVSVCDGAGAVLTPCGRCRQVLREFGGDDLLVDSAAGPRTLGSLLPDAFGPEHLRNGSDVGDASPGRAR